MGTACFEMEIYGKNQTYVQREPWAEWLKESELSIFPRTRTFPFSRESSPGATMMGVAGWCWSVQIGYNAIDVYFGY